MIMVDCAVDGLFSYQFIKFRIGLYRKINVEVILKFWYEY